MDRVEFTNLSNAIIKFNLPEIKRLLDFGTIDLDYVDESDPTCLLIEGFQSEFWALDDEWAKGTAPRFSEPPADVTKLLLEYGANPNVADEDGLMPLDRAVGLARRPDGRMDHPEAVRLLLSYGGKASPTDS